MKKLLLTATLLAACAPALTLAAGASCGHRAALAAKQAALGQTAIGRALSGGAIRDLLAGNSALFEDGARQYFTVGGRTLYQAPGRALEHGKWRVRGDSYCSTWEPFGGETCYAVHSDGELVTWDNKTPARMRTGNVFP